MSPDDAVAVINDLLPWWVIWLPPVLILAFAFFVPLFAGALASRVARPSASELDGKHWTERARLLFPDRLVTRVSMVSIPIMVGLLVYSFQGERLGLPSKLLPVTGAVLALIAGGLIRINNLRRVQPELKIQKWLHEVAAFHLTAMPHLFPVLLIAVFMPRELNAVTCAFFLLAVAMTVAAQFGIGLRIAQAFGLARDLPAPVLGSLRRLATELGLQLKGGYLVESSWANAAAFTSSGTVVVTSRALDLLSPPELEAVLVHELGHLAEPRSIRILRAVVGVVFISTLTLLHPIAGTFGVAGLLLTVVSLLMLVIAAKHLYRRLEERADAAVGRHGNGDPRTLGMALERLYEANLIPAVMRGKQVHPDLYDRLIACGLEPAYPRPSPPPWGRSFAAITMALIIPSAVVVASMWMSTKLRFGSLASTSTQPLYEMVFSGAGRQELTKLAAAMYAEGEYEAAEPLFEAIATLYPNAFTQANFAITEANAGRCETASIAAANARALAPDDSNGTVAKAARAVERCLHYSQDQLGRFE